MYRILTGDHSGLASAWVCLAARVIFHYGWPASCHNGPGGRWGFRVLLNTCYSWTYTVSAWSHESWLMCQSSALIP